MSKATDDMLRWIAETQMFQSIAGVEESASEELEAEWKSMTKARQKRELDHIITHRTIQELARGGK